MSSTGVIEHPVFFDMRGLSDNLEEEICILQGLNDLLHSKYSNLYFLFAGRVLESKGVPFTHALVSRFPSADALRTYYSNAIPDIAKQMRPWLKDEFCVDYVVQMEESAKALDVTKDSATLVTFIKAKSSVSDADIRGAMDAFLALAKVSDYAQQLTCGENEYSRQSYRTMSHAFSAYFPSLEALENWQKDKSVVSFMEEKILPMADAYSMVSLVPFAKPVAEVVQ